MRAWLLGELEISFTQLKALHLLDEGGDVPIKDVGERLSALADFTASLSPEERAGLHTALLPIVERIPTP